MILIDFSRDFIAFDEDDKYDNKAKDIIRNNTRLHLNHDC